MWDLYLQTWRHSFLLHARARRKELLAFFLFNFLIFFALGFLIAFTGSEESLFNIVVTVVSLATIIPSFTQTVRRLHDLGRSGWWFLLALVPIVNLILMIFLYCMPSAEESNEWGEPASNM